MLHVLGMAKSSVDLRGAKASKLELDFLKLAYAVASIRCKGEGAVGYLQVLEASSHVRALGWVEKYQTRDSVDVRLNAPNAEELAVLLAEKARNKVGLLPDTDRVTDALAAIGEELGERILGQTIIALHPDLERIVDQRLFPLGIRWDFYGIVRPKS